MSFQSPEATQVSETVNGYAAVPDRIWNRFHNYAQWALHWRRAGELGYARDDADRHEALLLAQAINNVQTVPGNCADDEAARNRAISRLQEMHRNQRTGNLKFTFDFLE